MGLGVLRFASLMIVALFFTSMFFTPVQAQNRGEDTPLAENSVERSNFALGSNYEDRWSDRHGTNKSFIPPGRERRNFNPSDHVKNPSSHTKKTSKPSEPTPSGKGKKR